MSNFDPEKLSIKFMPPATSFVPVEGRKYTLTHSDVTGELFLSIGYVYDYQAIDQRMRDEVIARWQRNDQEQYVLFGRAYISGGEFGEIEAAIRFTVFQREMETALRAIVYGDRNFYANYPTFLDNPIYIYYYSIYPQFNRIFYYKTPRQYLSLQ